MSRTPPARPSACQLQNGELKPQASGSARRDLNTPARRGARAGQRTPLPDRMTPGGEASIGAGSLRGGWWPLYIQRTYFCAVHGYQPLRKDSCTSAGALLHMQIVWIACRCALALCSSTALCTPLCHPLDSPTAVVHERTINYTAVATAHKSLTHDRSHRLAAYAGHRQFAFRRGQTRPPCWLPPSRAWL